MAKSDLEIVQKTCKNKADNEAVVKKDAFLFYLMSGVFKHIFNFYLNKTIV